MIEDPEIVWERKYIKDRLIGRIRKVNYVNEKATDVVEYQEVESKFEQITFYICCVMIVLLGMGLCFF